MSFEKFMDKVLESADGEEDVAPQPSDEQQARPVMTEEEFEDYLVERMNALLAEAGERGAPYVFANVVSWKLAALAYRCGPEATGNIVSLFGKHLEQMAETGRAQREAEQAKKEGHLPN